MTTRTRLVAATVLMAGVMTTGTTLLVASGASAGASPAASYTCSGGSPTNPTMIPAGSYGPVTITGFCAMQGTYSIHGGLTIAPGASLDASGTSCDVFLNVSGGIEVGSQGILNLGNGEGTGCPNSNDVVSGGITAVGADTVVVHGTTINGTFTMQGGGGAASCRPIANFPFSPPYFNVEDSRVNGGFSLTGVNTCWIGIIRNQVNGGGQVSNNETSDTDAIEIGLNSIHGGLSCVGNTLNPAVPADTTTPGAGNGAPTNFFDGFGPNPNTVTGAETGQCAGL